MRGLRSRTSFFRHTPSELVAGIRVVPSEPFRSRRESMQEAVVTARRGAFAAGRRGLVLLAALVALSVVAAGSAHAQSAPITPGAKWQDIPDLGVAGSHTYLYTPSVLFN